MPQAAKAHSTGASWNAVDGSYTVDVGYEPAQFTAGEYTRFDFRLWKGADEDGAAPYAQVWVRIVRADSDTVLATGIWQQPVGPTTLLYEFSAPGTYKLQTSFRDKDGTDIAVASFPITVQPGPKGSSNYLMPGIALMLGLVVGGGGAVFMHRGR